MNEHNYHRDKLHPSQPPEKPWQKIGADHWGPTPDGTGRHLLVLIDYLTKYPEVAIVKSTSAKNNIGALEEIFGRNGYPQKIISDNGPPWNGTDTHAMQKYLVWAGVKHVPTISADDPEANGQVERFMQQVEKAWERSYLEGKDPMSGVNNMLKVYRNTEHSVTGHKPAEWLLNREIKTREIRA